MGVSSVIDGIKKKIINSKVKNLKVLKSWAEEFEKMTPFFVWRNLIKQFLEIEFWKEKMRSKTMKKITKRMAIDPREDNLIGQLQVQLDSNWREYLPLLNDIHRFPPFMVEENSFTLKLKGGRRYEYTSMFLKHIFENQSEKFLIIIEDIQWIDNYSFNLISDIVTDNPNLISIFSLRVGSEQEEDFRNFFQKKINLTDFKLTPLSFTNISKIMMNILEVDAIPAQLNKIIENAHGNPLFAVQIANALKQSDLIEIQNRKCNVLKNDNLELLLPNTIEEYIGSRIDKIPPGPQLVNFHFFFFV